MNTAYTDNYNDLTTVMDTGGADSVGHGRHIPPSFTNDWARGAP